MMFRRLQFLQWVLVILAVESLFYFRMENANANQWRVISELPTERTGFATAVVDNKIYLIGGTPFEQARGVLREPGPGIWRGPFGMSLVEVYDPETNTWQRLTDMPTARHKPIAAVVDGKIYVLAGYIGKDNRGINIKHLAVVEMYDPQTDTWVKKREMSIPRVDFGTGVVAGKIYAIGGTVHPMGNKPGAPWRLDLVEVYDPATDTWTKRANLPTRRTGLKTAVIRNALYAIGGSGWPRVGNQGGPFLGTIEVYEPRINRWTKRPDMPHLRGVSSSMVVIADKIYFIAGHALEAARVLIDERLASTLVYDPVIERWDLIPTAPTRRFAFSAAVVNGRIYSFGGHGEEWWELFADVEVFDTGFRAVTATGKLPVHWGALKAEPQKNP